jgi:hypothetical protein
MKNLAIGDDASGRSIELASADREAHTHVIGSSGSGKSKFLELMMRQDLVNQQGFCLIDPHGTLYNDVLSFASHRVLNREIVLLNLSKPESIVGFNPFRSSAGDVSVQVGRRISATTHAWGVANTDDTPTLERVLRLIYTALLEQDLPFHFAQFLIDFNSREIREALIQKIQSALIRREWEELQQLKAKDWRGEVLSAKNRLFRLLTSKTLGRFFNASGQVIDIAEIIEKGKVLLVNLAPSDDLSDENAKVFGALLVNEFFEVARRRNVSSGYPVKPYYLYLDEFQTFVSLAVTAMLDQVRKYKLFTVLAHQRFGQLDENLMDAVLTNCRIKAVFGGLPVEMAKMMAQELFIGELDPQKIKVAIYQTKFWPKYGRDKAYSHSWNKGRAAGEGNNLASGSSTSNVSGEFFQPQDWFGDLVVGSSATSVTALSSVSGRHTSRTDFEGEAGSETDVPILLPVPFQELSSVQYYTTEEQLIGLTAALKENFTRHCFIKIHGQKTQPMRVPLITEYKTPLENKQWYEKRLMIRAGAVSAGAVDENMAAEEAALRGSVQGPKKSGKKGGRPRPEDIQGRE